MKVDYQEDGLYLLRGETLDSNATVLESDGRAVVIEGMASQDDASALASFAERELGLEVRYVIATHYFSDHLAALGAFPGAEVVAHELYQHTFDSEKHRTDEERGFYVRPTLLVRDGLVLRWGRFTLDIFHNPGHSMSTLNIDVPEADLLHVGDTVVGGIAYFSYTSPELFAAALERLRRRWRSRVLASHGGLRPASALDHSLHYLTTLGRAVRSARTASSGVDDAILSIPLEACIAPGAAATPFERIFHARNLESTVERGLYGLEEPAAPRRRPVEVENNASASATRA
jgi:glyoxylase-like metal-dependent hydrolase (beta-lactamase superfamily II)